MDRLEKCDHWHPDTPSRLALQGKFIRCKECARMRTNEHRDRAYQGRDYGVLPRLVWPAPEFLT